MIDIGEVPTPMVYFGSFHLRTGCCVSVTGSHNPPDYNGFKIVIDGETLSGDAIQNLYARIAENRLLRADGPGLLSIRDIKSDYIQRIAGDIQIERQLKVVVDCGNGVAGAIAPELLEAIGADVEPAVLRSRRHLPQPSSRPSDPHNLQDLIQIVKRVDADLGLAFDGDGDRLGVVTKSGEIIYPDRLLMLFAADVLERNPGACIIYDVKCTGHLPRHILRHGGSPLMWKTGHSLIKAKMKETEAELAGEMSGHFFFRERWYGFDDGMYAAARLLEILASSPDDAETMFAALPKGVSTPEIKVDVAEGEQYSFVERFVARAQVRGRAHRDHRRPARRLAGRLGPGARVQHHADPGAAFRRQGRGDPGTRGGGVPRTTAGGQSGPEVAVLNRVVRAGVPARTGESLLRGAEACAGVGCSGGATRAAAQFAIPGQHARELGVQCGQVGAAIDLQGFLLPLFGMQLADPLGPGIEHPPIIQLRLRSLGQHRRQVLAQALDADVG